MNGRQRYLVDLDPRSAVHLFDAAEVGITARPGNPVNLQDFRTRALLRSYPDLWHVWRGLSNLGANTTLALAFDLRNGGAVYLQGRTTEFPISRAVANFCGEVVRPPWIEWVRIDTWARC